MAKKIPASEILRQAAEWDPKNMRPRDLLQDAVKDAELLWALGIISKYTPEEIARAMEKIRGGD